VLSVQRAVQRFRTLSLPGILVHTTEINGGAVYFTSNSGESSPVFIDAMFKENSSGYAGGAFYSTLEENGTD